MRRSAEPSSTSSSVVTTAGRSKKFHAVTAAPGRSKPETPSEVSLPQFTQGGSRGGTCRRRCGHSAWPAAAGTALALAATCNRGGTFGGPGTFMGQVYMADPAPLCHATPFPRFRTISSAAGGDLGPARHFQRRHLRLPQHTACSISRIAKRSRIALSVARNEGHKQDQKIVAPGGNEQEAVNSPVSWSSQREVGETHESFSVSNLA